MQVMKYLHIFVRLWIPEYFTSLHVDWQWICL